MNVLLFGGTRFIGKSLVYRLLSLGHFVTVVSRRDLSQKENLTCWVGERPHSYADLKLQAFDCIIDFIAYSENEVSDTLNAFPGCPYVLISTCWIDALGQQGRTFNCHERRYVESKFRAEKAVRDICGAERAFTICRLPITFGNNDHSQRFSFYSYRLIQNKAILLINGGTNLTQIAFKDDISLALSILINKNLIGIEKICDLLPANLVSPRELVRNIADALKVSPKIRDIASNELEKNLPTYHLMEPLWRELPISSKLPNLNDIVGVSPVHASDWIKDLCSLKDNLQPIKLTEAFAPDLLAEELRLVNCS